MGFSASARPLSRTKTAQPTYEDNKKETPWLSLERKTTNRASAPLQSRHRPPKFAEAINLAGNCVLTLAALIQRSSNGGGGFMRRLRAALWERSDVVRLIYHGALSGMGDDCEVISMRLRFCFIWFVSLFECWMYLIDVRCVVFWSVVVRNIFLIII